jgi:apolipoprotein N-acyltransferase
LTDTTAPIAGGRPGRNRAVALLWSGSGDLGLLLVAAVLFALAHPNPLMQWGLGPLAFVALAPVFMVLRRAGWVRVLPYGVAFGYVSYALYNY